MADTNTFVINFEGEWVRMTEGQASQVESAAKQAGLSWKNIRTRVINTNILLGMSDELSLGLPNGITKSEVEKGQEILRDIYIRWAREKGEMDESSELFLRGQITGEEWKARNSRSREIK